jgi:hypothetical protein
LLKKFGSEVAKLEVVSSIFYIQADDINSINDVVHELYFRRYQYS